MKKAVSLIFTFLILCSFAVNVNAEEFNGADLFTVDLPEDFEQTSSDSTDFTFTNEKGETLTISYNDNTQKNGIFSPADMSKKEIQAYTDTLSEASESFMKDYADEFEMKFLSGEKIKHKNGKIALVCQTKTTITNDKKENIYYQTMYEFGGINYKYTFTYTTADEKNKNSFNEVFEGINIFEGETDSNLDKLAEYALAGGLALLLVLGIIRFIRTPEKREKGKLK